MISDEKSLLRRALDVIGLSEKYASVRTTMFLNPEEQRFLGEELKHRGEDSGIRFFGGYREAERRLMIAVPEWEEEPEFPITLLKISGGKRNGLSHRDYLGAVLGLGLRRESVGDILVCDEETYLFVMNDIAGYIVDNLKKIGSYGVSVLPCDWKEELLPEPEFLEITGTVASLRLDAVLALAARQSRSMVQKWIEGERVMLNYRTVSSGSAVVKEDDRISVRGFGKMKVDHIGGQSKKGRRFITVKKYI